MSLHICLIAGEPSGDFLGSRLAMALNALRPDIRFSGVGGPQMRAAGVSSLFAYEDLAVMGVAEILPRLPTLLARIRQTIEHIKETKPDIVVTVDSPDFSFRVLKTIRNEMGANAPKLIHYVAPTVWAWREGRAAKIAKFLDGLICLFDFEPPFFERHGLSAIAVGHPMVEGDAMMADGDAFRRRHGIGEKDIAIGMLFGSRKGELKNTAPVLRDALGQLSPNATIIAPTLPHVRGDALALLSRHRGKVIITTEPEEKWSAFKAMSAAMAVSGTVALELAALRIPHVTAAIIRRMIRVKYAHLANIMVDAAIVPEFLQENCKAEKIAATVRNLMDSPQGQIAQFETIAYKLGFRQQNTPSEKAADFVLSFIDPCR